MSSFIDGSGRFVAVPRRPRIADLSVVPSPFLEGVFAPLIESHPGTAWRTVWETNRGCPFKCTFCDWGSAIAAKVHRFELDRIHAEAEWIARNGIDYLFIGDANFGILPRDVEIAEAVVAAAKRHGYPKKVLVQQTKNATDRAYLTMKTIAEGGLATEMNISIQTTTPEVLEAIKRQNISLETYAELQRRFVHDGIPTFVDMIVGLPAETLQSFKESISSVIERGQHHRVQFHNLTILPNAEMGDPEYQRQYALKTVTCKIVNNHASADAPPDGIYETQELVVSSSSYDEEGWREMRSFSWLTLLYHMHHLLLPSILVTWKLSGLPIWRAIDALVQADPEQCPTLAEMRRFCLDFAGRMQGGGDEYVYSEDWLDQFWTVDEYLLIRLCLEDRLADLYAEARETLMPLLPPATAELDPSEALGDAIRLNEARMRHPLVRRLRRRPLRPRRSRVLRGRVAGRGAGAASRADLVRDRAQAPAGPRCLAPRHRPRPRGGQARGGGRDSAVARGGGGRTRRVTMSEERNGTKARADGFAREDSTHDDPFPFFAQLRREDPLHRDGNGLLRLTRYDDIVAVFRDDRLSANDERWQQYDPIAETLGGSDSPAARARRQWFLNLDDPEHRRLRSGVASSSRPRASAAYRPAIQFAVDHLLERLRGSNEADLLESVIRPFPAGAVASAFGFPPDDWRPIVAWIRDINRNFDRMRTSRRSAQMNAGGRRVRGVPRGEDRAAQPATTRSCGSCAKPAAGASATTS